MTSSEICGGANVGYFRSVSQFPETWKQAIQLYECRTVRFVMVVLSRPRHAASYKWIKPMTFLRSRHKKYLCMRVEWMNVEGIP